MTIDIHRPELETAIRQHMATGAFEDLDALFSRALAALPPPDVSFVAPEGESLLAVFDQMRGLLTDEEVDTLFTRDSSPARDIGLQ